MNTETMERPLPTIDVAQAVAATVPPAGAVAVIDLKKIDLASVALAHFGDWRKDVEDCWRRPNFDPPCRSNFDPGGSADLVMVGCG